VTPGIVLYNGDRHFVVHDVHVMNLMQVENIWETLTSPDEEI